jgi:hypothetical protein
LFAKNHLTLIINFQNLILNICQSDTFVTVKGNKIVLNPLES